MGRSLAEDPGSAGAVPSLSAIDLLIQVRHPTSQDFNFRSGGDDLDMGQVTGPARLVPTRPTFGALSRLWLR